VEPAQRFSAIFREHSRALLAYALRRVEQPQDAADVVAETMLVAWRRLGDVPGGEETRPWLFGVARRVLLNHHRSQRRATRLGERLKATLVEIHLDHQDDGAEVREALARLSEEDREILRLTAWEELDPTEIAVALGVPAGTVRSRLHRARARLRHELERDERAGHVRADGHPLVRDLKGEA
jgi:RNA polymerase sigma-70 factor (ECF subfamily)